MIESVGKSAFDHLYVQLATPSIQMALSASLGSSKRALSAAVTCLVDGCASDLSDCRKYYQRHKVCEIHSKTPQVSIDGQNLRFCQQCSRFHSLEEFDEGKRSCRKRLDGHNRRRRKPLPYLFPPNHGTNNINVVQSDGQQVHPTVDVNVMNPPWSEVVQAPLWLDHSNYAPSLLSSPVASIPTLSHVVNPQSDSGSVSVTASPLDQGLISYGGLENDFDVGWGGVTDMDTYHHASYDQTLPFYWQS
ncbi:hypothetical protein L1987_66873 [Smallanthus sonchifolius]|uniref:Uncharacterized protein n=1 Tax=Smallanthus sonchifolius TaxID=185202 RepID=A0ACB9BYH6_9ASTR|nr:hypothetical protein L1987_66873 [Smallanthus sonchifolius]